MLKSKVEGLAWGAELAPGVHHALGFLCAKADLESWAFREFGMGWAGTKDSVGSCDWWLSFESDAEMSSWSRKKTCSFFLWCECTKVIFLRVLVSRTVCSWVGGCFCCCRVGLSVDYIFFLIIEHVWLVCCPVGVYKNLKHVYSWAKGNKQAAVSWRWAHSPHTKRGLLSSKTSCNRQGTASLPGKPGAGDSVFTAAADRHSPLWRGLSTRNVCLIFMSCYTAHCAPAGDGETLLFQGWMRCWGGRKHGGLERKSCVLPLLL